MHKYLRIAVKLVVCPALLAVGGCDSARNQLEQIKDSGEIRVVTVYGPTTYFIDTDSETGFEYELARLFARSLDVNLKMIIAVNKAEMAATLERGEADIAAGLLKQTFEVNGNLQAGPEYYNVTQQVIYKRGVDRPDALDELNPFPLHIADGGIRPAKLEYIKKQFPEFSWKLHDDKSSNDIIELIQEDQIAYGAVFSNEFLLAQQTYPELRMAFELSEPTPLAWFIQNGPDDSLLSSLKDFFETLASSETLAEMVEYFYGPVQKFDYVDQRRFIARFEQRLPKYEDIFREVAEEYNFDWRMLAAMSYQESHWNERARSPTGVRGLMMLTLTTAKQLGVTNRLDPEQSIKGGAKYISQLLDRVPERIPYPDRMWFALAAYNIGFGHLEDARRITQGNGGDPDKWEEVKRYLPYLQNSEWYKKTLFGYARGNEAVRYVESIRKYYNTLVQLTHETPQFEQSGNGPMRLVELDSLVL